MKQKRQMGVMAERHQDCPKRHCIAQETGGVPAVTTLHCRQWGWLMSDLENLDV